MHQLKRQMNGRKLCYVSDRSTATVNITSLSFLLVFLFEQKSSYLCWYSHINVFQKGADRGWVSEILLPSVLRGI